MNTAETLLHCVLLLCIALYGNVDKGESWDQNIRLHNMTILNLHATLCRLEDMRTAQSSSRGATPREQKALYNQYKPYGLT